MTWGSTAVAGATVVAGYMGQQGQAKSQQEANVANLEIAQQQQAEQARQFDLNRADQQLLYGAEQDKFAFQTHQGQVMSESRRAREDLTNQQIQGRFEDLRGENVGRLDPYSLAGQQATEQRAAFMGLRGTEAEQAARQGFSESAGQRFLRERAEKGLLRASSKIGGLGGGRIGSALNEQAIDIAAGQEQQYLQNLSALSGEGLAAGQSIANIRGPGYVTTGQDAGVAKTPYNPNPIKF